MNEIEESFIRIMQPFAHAEFFTPETLLDSLIEKTFTNPKVIAAYPDQAALMLDYLKHNRPRALQLIAGAMGLT